MILIVRCILFACLLCASAWAQPLPAGHPPPADVVLDDLTVFPVNAPIGPFSPEERASSASRKLLQYELDPADKIADVTTADHENTTDIMVGDTVLTTITDADAAFDLLRRSHQQIATADAEQARRAITLARQERSPRSLTIGALKALAALLVLGGFFYLLRLLFPALYLAIERRRTRIHTIRIQSAELFSAERLAELVLQLARLLRFAVTLILLYVFIPLVFSFFADTRSFGFTLIRYVVSPISAGCAAFIAYFPRLLVVLVIIFFARQALRLARFFFREIERGTIVWPGFYPEWAMPTHRIVQVILIAFTLVVVFPYLPGSDSAAFKGVSIFLGVLFSLGSSSAIANIFAGVLLTYTRAFQVGDRVQISDTTGDVIEKTLLATHIRTIKNVNVTVPNSLVLTSHIVNFSRSPPDQPLLLHTSITIGYENPWRQIHQLLIAAALATDGILAEPSPFVFQNALDDFYISYQINAATDRPAAMQAILSELHGQILDHFNQAGVEIMSPHYATVRRNEHTTIPVEFDTAKRNNQAMTPLESVD